MSEMSMRLVAAVLVAIGLDGNAAAHHGFATFGLDRSIEIEGEIIAVY